MIIVMRHGATDKEVQHVISAIEESGCKAHVSRGVERTIIGAVGQEDALRALPFAAFEGVETATAILKPYKLASREMKPQKTVVQISPSVSVGGDEIIIMSGPCSVEPGNSIYEAADGVKAAGAKVLRGGAFKPRTSPYDFQGMGEEGLKMLAEARSRTGLAVITEVMDTRDVELVYKYTDIFQLGARNMQNFNLLKEVGKTDKPVLLKRGISATIKEWIMSAEYILSQGNMKVIMCERGIRSYDTATRNLFDATAVAIVKAETHLPVVVDPSHAGGHWKWVEPISRAALAIGADGLIIEAHPNPEKAMSDGAQSLRLPQLAEVIDSLRPIARAVGRTL